MKERMQQRTCSFCGRPESEVSKIIAGTSAQICNECVLLCIDILDEEGATGLPTSEGQILVRFVDGSARICERLHAWIPFTCEGASLEWCGARARVDSTSTVPVVAVRMQRMDRRAVGSTLPEDTAATEAIALRVVDAFGGPGAIGQPRLTRPKIQRRKLLGVISDAEVTSFLSQQYRVPTIDLDAYEVAPEILELVPAEMCKKRMVLPVSRAGSSLIVAMADPTNADTIDALKRLTEANIEPVIATEAAIRRAIAKYFG
jgi:hypothetical protein